MTEDRKVSIAETIGGSSVRKYLNENVTKELLKGVRKVALERPENPLLFLGQYLIERSRELENISKQGFPVEKQKISTAAVKKEIPGNANEHDTTINNSRQNTATTVDIQEQEATKETDVEMKEEPTKETGVEMKEEPAD